MAIAIHQLAIHCNVLSLFNYIANDFHMKNLLVSVKNLIIELNCYGTDFQTFHVITQTQLTTTTLVTLSAQVTAVITFW